MTQYWFNELSGSQSWTSLWSGYILCRNCRGIRTVKGRCPVCSDILQDSTTILEKTESGKEVKLPQTAYMGAEGRYEDYVYLNMLEYEWKRPISSFDNYNFLDHEKKPAAKAIIVLIFWTYFETRIERLLTTAMSKLPATVKEHLIKKHQSISSRTNELYKILFGDSTSYHADLRSLGFINISTLLLQIQDRRNKFMHGQPEAIDDELVENIVASLKDEHQSWIEVYNLRLASMLNSR